jgi:hypothetical protein
MVWISFVSFSLSKSHTSILSRLLPAIYATTTEAAAATTTTTSRRRGTS